MTFKVEEVAFEDMSDEELQPILDLQNAIHAEEGPRHVDLTMTEFRAFSAMPGMLQKKFRVSDADGHVVGLGTTRYPDDGSDSHLLQCSIRVARDSRRNGIGSLLLANAVQQATDLGRGTIQLYHFDTVPAAQAFVDAVGAKPVLEMHSNLLKVADLDVELMKRWVDAGASKARGYRVDIYEGRWPEEILEGMARLYYILDRDSPQAEGHEVREWTPELIDQFQSVFLKGVDSLMALAIHEESDVAVGMSQLIRRNSDPSTWIVTTTMVDPDHRGNGLGRWTKGAVNLAALDRWDGGVYQETANAFANAPMLAINDEMGFEHEHTFTESEVSVERAEAFVKARGL